MVRHRQAEDLRHVGDPLGFEESAGVAQVGMQNVAALIDDEILEALPPREVLAGADRARASWRTSRFQDSEYSTGSGSSSQSGLIGSTASAIWIDVRRSYSQWQWTMMSWSQPIASRQFSKPWRIWISSLVVSTLVAEVAPVSVCGLVCGKPNLCAVKPLGSAFTFCAHSRHDALSSMLRGAA